MGKGIRAEDIRKVRSEYDLFRVKEGHNYDLDKTISYLVSKLNQGYDYFGALFLGLLKLLSKTGLPLKDAANKWQLDRDYFCSELCYEAFFHGGGLDIVPAIPEADVTSPEDIANSSVVEQV